MAVFDEVILCIHNVCTTNLVAFAIPYHEIGATTLHHLFSCVCLFIFDKFRFYRKFLEEFWEVHLTYHKFIYNQYKTNGDWTTGCRHVDADESISSPQCRTIRWFDAGFPINAMLPKNDYAMLVL